MAWECAECNMTENTEEDASETITIEVVCHHCGKPLCRRDRIQISDDGFSDADTTVSNKAFHCKECHRKYHPRVAVGDWRAE